MSLFALMPIWALIFSLIDFNGQATLLFAGDAMMHQAQIDAAKCSNGEYCYSDCFEQLSPVIKNADYAVVNLEVPLGGKPYSGYPVFSSPDSYAKALQDAGFDLFLTANNHTLDKHDRGLKRTIEALNDMGILHIGTYRNQAERDSILPFIKSVKGINIAFLNYTYGTNGIEIQGDAVVDYINKEKIRKDIANARNAGAELVCVAMHWGEEYRLLPNSSQRALADFLLSEGVDMVIGGHPHVIQPMEMRVGADGKNKLVVYSLGNFISNMKIRDGRGGALAEVYLSRDSVGVAQVDSAAYRLVFTIPGKPGRNYRVVEADDCDSKEWMPKRDEFVKSARAIFDKHNINVPQVGE